MFFKNKKASNDTLHPDAARFQAVARSQAVIEFELDGTVVNANDNFLNFTGYRLDEIVGRHHSMFLDPQEAASPDYREFWRRLNAGEFVATKFRRLVKGGREAFIEASYNPIFDSAGRPMRVIKIATDITEAEQRARRNEEERHRAEQVQTKVVSTLAAALKKLADGDLTSRIEAEFEGGYAALRSDYNRAVDSMAGAMSAIATNTGAVGAGSNQISTAADDLSSRTERQAASLEETAAALDQVTATVRKSADNAKEAAAQAEGSRSEAETAGVVVHDAVDAMGQIERSSNQIAQIIGVIDEIAFQTNLLALNAGVEAARAGEAGKGFAVVASEVRALAQRAADAAKEIKALIATSTEQVGRGVQLVGATGKALEKLVERAAGIETLVRDIARASQEQAIGLGEVNTAVNQMDQVTQQNAAMVEETTAAASQLQTQARALAQAVGRFRLASADDTRFDAHNDAPYGQPRKLRAVGGGAGAWAEF